MPSLSIKNVPDVLIERLRVRAKGNHRSLQGEIMSILEDATLAPPKLTVRELGERIRRLGLRTGDDSTRWIRELRDAR
ncbi:MAG: Arc family DNA-binding protein [Chloroflexi bacterium]|nr:Arc family DNA-binding protein [Chloroflexota bacterium]MCH8225549.1 Arc family DNA-binding protein [Chloroflexota bacterium]MCI0846524.1 Arc family DNA-binding protein [Chloroflexota bacterium]